MRYLLKMLQDILGNEIFFDIPEMFHKISSRSMELKFNM